MHFSWMALALLAVGLIVAHILITFIRRVIVKHRMVWFTQELTAAGSQIRHTAQVFCECCHTRRRRMIIYTYGGNELAPHVAHVCYQCHKRLHPMIQQRLQGAEEQPEGVTGR